MNHTTSSMTEGSIWKKITFFALPLFMSSLFQQLYNVADSLIVGNFLGSDALAAVSSSGSVIFLMIGFFNGLSAGAGVVAARYYGSKSKENLQKAIHSTLALGTVCALFLTVIGLFLTPQILIWMDTPKDILSSSIVYLRIYFLGSLGFVLYNNCVSIFQAVGDSYHPLIYLIISSVTNIALDILFIAVLKLGIGSAACATVISEFISCFLCLHKLSRSPEEYRVSLKKIRFHRSVLNQSSQMDCRQDSKIPLFLLLTLLYNPLSTVSEKWLWPDAVLIQKLRGSAFCLLPVFHLL